MANVSAVGTYWDRAELMQAFNNVMGLSIDQHRFCFIIDGLDEYEGDHFELVQLFKKLSNHTNIKMCVSSRPWNVFQEVFGSHLGTHMYLEKFTRRDISTYVRDRMEQSALVAAPNVEDRRFNELTEEIVERAQGVFLWVVLAVRSLIRGLTNADTFYDLQRRLREFPRELEPFFHHIFNSIDPFYRPETAKYCLVALQARNSYRLITYSLLDERHSDSALRVYLRGRE